MDVLVDEVSIYHKFTNLRLLLGSLHHLALQRTPSSENQALVDSGLQSKAIGCGDEEIMHGKTVDEGQNPHGDGFRTQGHKCRRRRQ